MAILYAIKCPTFRFWEFIAASPNEMVVARTKIAAKVQRIVLI